MLYLFSFLSLPTPRCLSVLGFSANRMLQRVGSSVITELYIHGGKCINNRATYCDGPRAIVVICKGGSIVRGLSTRVCHKLAQTIGTRGGRVRRNQSVLAA